MLSMCLIRIHSARGRNRFNNLYIFRIVFIRIHNKFERLMLFECQENIGINVR